MKRNLVDRKWLRYAATEPNFVLVEGGRRFAWVDDLFEGVIRVPMGLP